MNEKIKEIIIDCNSGILSAIKKMDEQKCKLLIVTEKDKFYSLISIGDIQRAIIKNIPLDSSVKNIVRKKIKIAGEKDSFEDIRQKMIKYRMEFMPVISSDNKIIKVFFWKDIIGEEDQKSEYRLDIPAVIMAGGMGTRLKPITNIIPKALVPIGEKPIIQIIIEKLVKTGVKDFYISVNHKHEMIRNYIDNLPDKNYQVSYIHEDRPLGTAGSLYLLKGKINTPFIVSNCDILIDQDYSEVYNYHIENENEITVISALIHYSIPYGTLETGPDGILESFKEKPDITFQVNTGMYILEPHLIDEIPENDLFHITHLIEKVKNRAGKIGVFPVSEKSWIDIGKWTEYQQYVE